MANAGPANAMQESREERARAIGVQRVIGTTINGLSSFTLELPGCLLSTIVMLNRFIHVCNKITLERDVTRLVAPPLAKLY